MDREGGGGGGGVPCLCPFVIDPLSFFLCPYPSVPVLQSLSLYLCYLCPSIPIVLDPVTLSPSHSLCLGFSIPAPLFLSFNPCPSISAISVPLSPLSLTLSLCPRLIHSVLASLSLLLCSCPCPSLALYYNLYTLL